MIVYPMHYLDHDGLSPPFVLIMISDFSTPFWEFPWVPPGATAIDTIIDFSTPFWEFPVYTSWLKNLNTSDNNFLLPFGSFLVSAYYARYSDIVNKFYSLLGVSWFVCYLRFS